MNDVTLRSKLTCWTLIFALLSAFITPSIATAATPVKGDLDYLAKPPDKSNYQLVERDNQLKFVSFYATKFKPYAYDIGSTLLSDAYNAYRNTRYEKEITKYPLITLADIKGSYLKFDQVVGILDTYAPNYSKTFKYNLTEFIYGRLVKGNHVQNCYEWKADGTKKICFVGSDDVKDKKFAAQPTGRATALAAPTYTNSELVAQQNWINDIADADLNVIKQWHHAHFNMISVFLGTTQPQKSLNFAARQLVMETNDDKKRLRADGTKKPTVILNSTTRTATFELGNSTPRIEQPDLECANASLWSRLTHGCATTTASLQAHGNEAASVLTVENKTYPYENDTWSVKTTKYAMDENLTKAMRAGVTEQIRLLGGNITINVTDQNGTAITSYPSIYPSASTPPSDNPSKFPSCQPSSVPSTDPLALNPSPIPTTLPTIDQLTFDVAALLHKNGGGGVKWIPLAIDLVTIAQMGMVAAARARLSPEIPLFGYDIDITSYKEALAEAVSLQLGYQHLDHDSAMGRSMTRAAGIIWTAATGTIGLQVLSSGLTWSEYFKLVDKYPGQVPDPVKVRSNVNALLIGLGNFAVYAVNSNTLKNMYEIGSLAQVRAELPNTVIETGLLAVKNLGRDFANSDITGCINTPVNIIVTRVATGRAWNAVPNEIEIAKLLGVGSRLFGAGITYAEKNGYDIYKSTMSVFGREGQSYKAITINTFTAAFSTVMATLVLVFRLQGVGL